MKLHTSVEVEWDERSGIFNIRLWQCHILVPHCLYLNVWLFTLKASCGRVHYNRSQHLCSQLNIQWPCYCISSFYYFMFHILLWLFSFASSRFPTFHYFPCPILRNFFFFTLISLLPSHSSSPPLYSIPRTLLIFLPLFTAQASLTQCVYALNFKLLGVHSSERESCMPIRSLCRLSSRLSPRVWFCVAHRSNFRINLPIFT